MKIFNTIGKKGLMALAIALSFGVSVNAAEILKRDTVFAIDNMYPASLSIFKVKENTLIDKNVTAIPTPQGAAVGLAISTKNKLLFVSYEGSGIVDVISAETGTPLPQLTIPGTSNIAGIVVSEGRNRFYAVDRRNTHLYVYDMKKDGNVSRVTSEEFDLSNGAYGIDVWSDRLYATHADNIVTIYDLKSKTEVNRYSTSESSNMGIAVDGSDSKNVLVYTTWTSQRPNPGVLTQYNINTDVEKRINLGRDGRGLSVNPALGLVYAIAGDNSDSVTPVLRTYGKNQFTITPSSPTPLDEDDLTLGGGGPTDIVAVGVTFNPDVTIEITDPADKNISLCNYATFTVKVKNPSPRQSLIIDGMEDNYNNADMTFVSSSVTTDDTVDDGSITWSSLNQMIAANSSWTFTTKFLATNAVNATYQTIKITDAVFADGSPAAFENTIYFDISNSTDICPKPPVIIPPKPTPPDQCCEPQLKNRGSGPAIGLFGGLLFGFFMLLMGNTMTRRENRK